MLTLYTLQIIMLLGALSFIAVPFIKTNSLFSKKFLLISVFFIFFSLLLYQTSGDKYALKQWLTQGKQHYNLLETFENLGGIEGAITKIEKRLEINPTDAQGWLILGKLYLAKQENAKAKNAFRKAYDLNTENDEIKRLYRTFCHP